VALPASGFGLSAVAYWVWISVVLMEENWPVRIWSMEEIVAGAEVRRDSTSALVESRICFYSELEMRFWKKKDGHREF